MFPSNNRRHVKSDYSPEIDFLECDYSSRYSFSLTSVSASESVRRTELWDSRDDAAAAAAATAAADGDRRPNWKRGRHHGTVVARGELLVPGSGGGESVICRRE